MPTPLSRPPWRDRLPPRNPVPSRATAALSGTRNFQRTLYAIRAGETFITHLAEGMDERCDQLDRSTPKDSNRFGRQIHTSLGRASHVPVSNPAFKESGAKCIASPGRIDYG